MTSKKLVSVIFPTRARHNSLVQTLDSLIDNCSSIEQIEILIKLDDDDLETLEQIKSYKNIKYLTVVVSDRKKGYESLHELYNELYEKATGEFIFCLNDDATVMTENWDKLIEPYAGKSVCLHHNPTYPHNDVWYFPIVSKEILDVIGCVSRSVFYDGYVFHLLENLDIFERIDLTINHHTIQDSLTSEKFEIIEKFRRDSEWEFNKKRPLLINDREKIINYLNKKNS